MLLRSGKGTLGGDKLDDFDFTSHKRKWKAMLYKERRCAKDNSAILLTHLCILVYILTGTETYNEHLDRYFTDDIDAYVYTAIGFLYCSSAIMFGYFGDIFGGCATLKASLLLAAVRYAVMGFTYAFPSAYYKYSLCLMPFLIMSAIFQHVLLCSQIIVTNRADRHNRANLIGRLGMTHGIAMVAGPSFSKYINQLIGKTPAAFASCVAMLLCSVVIHQLIPAESHQNCSPGNNPYKRRKMINFWMNKVFALFRNNQQGVFLLFVRSMLQGLSVIFAQSISEKVSIQDAYDSIHKYFDGMTSDNRYILVRNIELFAVLGQGILIGFISKRFSENAFIKLASVILIWTWVLIAYVQNGWQIILVVMLKDINLFISKTLLTTFLINTVPDSSIGTMMGVVLAVDAIVRTTAPALGRFLLLHLEEGDFAYFATSISVIVASVIFRKINKLENLKTPLKKVM